MVRIRGRSNMGDVLKGDLMKHAMAVKAEQIARNVRALGLKVGDRDGGGSEYDLPVKVETSVTDRAKATVLLAHPSGLAVQAKHGALTKAASEAGMEVKAK